MTNHAAMLTALGDLARRSKIARRVGTRRVYSVDPAGIGTIRDYFDQFWQQALARFATAATQPTQEEA